MAGGSVITPAIDRPDRWTPLEDVLDLPPEEAPPPEGRARADGAARIELDPDAPLLLGRYAVQRPLGAGPGAVVCAGLDVRSGRPVTLKLFRPSVAAAPGFEEWFERRAALAFRLRHPHLAAVLDAGFSEYGPFVVSASTTKPWMVGR